MEFRFTYLPTFEKSLEDIPHKHQKQILKKIKMLQSVKDFSIFDFVIPLALPLGEATHKLKVGNYRVFIKVESNVFEFQYVRIRGGAYK